ncbi:hypothetical protein BDN71DRAFT_1502447 [Pleurotus eryngii]|uniref:Uncharacterized protein n=1 Tax=Pleurotus eryngii TaxID=5323 RepID=A0A9P6A5G3_PLEER|nr:hypothetical protein BDN71DRAFT_1502447 [Pleurotus eryngii]
MANLSKDKDVLKPNPHPYAIKTTSTALLSRSNSSSQSARPIHSYIPSPSPSPTRSRPSQRQYGYSHGSGHRYSRSLTGDSPRPLPVPPSPSPTKQLYTSGHGHSPSFDVDLPANPKLWTPSQLATYLATALRVRSGESLQLPAPVARDIAAFVKTSKITGKEFLRFNEQDLNDYGINQLWSTALFAASRTLRQNVLKGRIWGFGNNDFNGPSSNDPPFGEHVQYDSASSTSSLDIDRSHSDNDFFDTTFQSNAKHPLDDVTPVKRARKGRVSVGKLRNGRVKGMVETFERSGSVDESTGRSGRTRSGSESSVGGSEDPVHPTLRPHQTGTAIYHTQPPQFLPPSHQVSEPFQSDAETYDTATEGGQYDTATEGGDEGGGSGEPSPQAPKLERVAQADEELSMEELLAQIEVEKSSGIHAWELDGNGTAIVTMKHLPSTSETPVERSISSVDSLKGRPLPHPPASGSPVVFLPAAQTLPSQSTGSRQLPALPNSHILAPKPQRGSLRGLGASWNAIDGDGVSLLTGGVDSLLSDDGVSDARNGSLGNSDGWTKAPSEGGSGKASKRRIRLSGGSGVSSGGGRVSVSRGGGGQTKRAGISELFGTSKEGGAVVESNERDGGDGPAVDPNVATEEASKRAASEDLLVERSRALEELQERIAEKEKEVQAYAAEKAAWVEREQTLQTELADALASVESYKTRLDEAEKRVDALKDAEERRRQSEASVAKEPIPDTTNNKSQKPAPTFSAGFNLGLFMNLVPQSVLGRVFRQRTVSLNTPESSRLQTAVGVGKDDVELGEAQKGLSQPATASPSAREASSTSSNRWKDWLALSPASLYSGSGASHGSSENEDGYPRQSHPWSNPATIRALPPYVFLVGLGVAAVVLRVVLRRVGYRLGLGVGVRR